VLENWRTKLRDARKARDNLLATKQDQDEEVQTAELLVQERKALIAYAKQLKFGKKMYVWLVWNGIYNEKGTCNQELPTKDLFDKHGKEVREIFASQQKKKFKVVRVARANPDDKESVSVRLEVPSFSVRRYQIINEYLPTQGYCGIKIGIKRIHKVKSLLLRILDKDNTLAYQELLKGEHLFALIPAQVQDSVKDEEIPALISKPSPLKKHPAGTTASVDKSPYTVQVWVAEKEDAFDANYDGKTDPAVEKSKIVDTGFVHDNMKQDKKDSVRKLEDTHKEISAKDVRLVNVALPFMDTTMGFHDKDYYTDIAGINAAADVPGKVSDDYQARIDKIFTLIDKARDKLGELADSEVCVFIASEWYFARRISGKFPNAERWHLTETEKNDILAKIQEKYESQDAYKKWIIIPGSILWGHAASVETAGGGKKDAHFNYVMNTLPIMYWDTTANKVETRTFCKSEHGNDTPLNFVPKRIRYKKFSNLSKDRATLPKVIIKQLRKLSAQTGDKLVAHMLPKKAPVITLDAESGIWAVETTREKKIETATHILKTKIILIRDGKNYLRVVPSDFFAKNMRAYEAKDYDSWRNFFNTCIDDNVKDTYIDDMQSRYFTISDLKFGCEICAESENAVALQNITQDTGVDIHLVSACDAMQFGIYSIAKGGGFRLYSDGAEEKRKAVRSVTREDTLKFYKDKFAELGKAAYYINQEVRKKVTEKEYDSLEFDDLNDMRIFTCVHRV
jgi:hypothetical protein